MGNQRSHYGVKIGNAMIDTGYAAQEVYRFCMATGWKAFKGDDAEYFLHAVPDPKDPRLTRTVRRLWHKTHVDPTLGRHRGTSATRLLPLFRWSNNWTKDELTNYLTGLLGDWTIPRTISREYLKQLSAENRVEKQDSRGRIFYVWQQVRRDNHLFDCELMLLVAAVITGTVNVADRFGPRPSSRS